MMFNVCEWIKTDSVIVFVDRKEFENNQLLSKISDEQAINGQLQKKMKELHVRTLHMISQRS